MKKELQLLGLTKNESMVYETLVKHGPSRAGRVITKLDLHRNLIYRALDGLVANGYATKVIRNGVWDFQTTDPQSLLTSMRRKEKIFDEVLKEISHYQRNFEQQIVVYEGLESYRKYWIDSISRFPDGSTDYVAGGELGEWRELMGKSTLKKYFDIAKKKKLIWKTIYFKRRDEEIKLLEKFPGNYEARIVDSNKDTELMGSNFNVIHDTVMLHSIVDTPRVIEIRDKAMVQLFQTYFNVLWEKAEPIKIRYSTE